MSYTNTLNKPLNIGFLHKKSERIAAALFLVSDIIPEGEMLRTKMRELSLTLVSQTAVLRAGYQYDFNTISKNLERTVLELMSCLDIASISGLISSMNASIVKKEFEGLLTSLSELPQISEYRNNLPPKFFNTDILEEDLSDKTKELKSQTPLVQNIPVRIEPKEKDKNADNKPRRKESRSKTILEVISKKGDVSIKDISASVKGCSEKTIQRELASMVQTGVLKKTGEKRWSRYALA